MSQSQGKDVTEKRKAFDSENESKNQQLGLRKRWLDLLSGILNVDKDFHQVAICELATGKVWAEIGGFKIYEPSTDEKIYQTNAWAQGDNVSRKSNLKQTKDPIGNEKPSEFYPYDSQCENEFIDEGLMLTSSSLKSIQQFEDTDNVWSNEQLPTRQKLGIRPKKR